MWGSVELYLNTDDYMNSSGSPITAFLEENMPYNYTFCY